MQDANMMYTVVGIFIPDRVNYAADVQKVLTNYGCSIRTRLGLHDVNEEYCANTGLLLLEMYGKESHLNEMVAKLKAISHEIDVQQMIFKTKKRK